ncbi:MAG TPA: SCO family protein [Ktedonobacteraceae bacterium]|jgi:cytochrome oxidase Cu insertion factor (SCO1/SenC/PrrC family)|nr:SCO family protein [Ktedonobacteraceae bacterium]
MQQPDGMQKLVRIAFILFFVLMMITATLWGIRLFTAHNRSLAQPTAIAAIGGFPMKGDPAPDFQLVDQFSQPMTLSSLRGHEIVLAFIDARCTTLCPLTAEIMYNARAHLTPAQAGQVVLVAVNANPTTTSVSAVQAWSINHGMLHQWSFLTGSAQQLQSVYHLYGVTVQVGSSGQLEHDASMFIIDAQGHMRLTFETFDSSSKSDLTSEESGLEAGMRQWLPKP